MLRQAFRDGEFAITCEFVPGRGKEGVGVDTALSFAKEVAQSGPRIHAVSLTDNPGGNPAIIPDALAPAIQQHGLEALVHFSCRDLNRNAVESRAMGLARAGVNNLLVVTGDHPSSGFEGNAAGVFDLDAVQAVKYLKAMNGGIGVPGTKKGTSIRLPPTNFFVGVAVSPFKSTEQELMPQFFKLEKKLAAGADFVITQLGYDMRKFLEVKCYMDSRGLKAPLLGNVYVLNRGAARTIHAGQVPGCVVTDALLGTIETEFQAPDKGKGKRLERAAKMVAIFKGMGFSGVHIGGFALKTQDFRFIVEHATEIASDWEAFVPEVCFGREGEFYAFPFPRSYRPSQPEDDPVRHLDKGRFSPMFHLFAAMHRFTFERRSRGCRLMTRYYRAIGKRSSVARISHLIEFLIKFQTFGCRNCGDCALADMAYCCPQGKCAKQQRNGPCGGSVDGRCEVFPDTRRCIWTVVYERLKSVGQLDKMRTDYVPPRKMELQDTSGWANYFLGNDHSQSAMVPASPTGVKGLTS